MTWRRIYAPRIAEIIKENEGKPLKELKKILQDANPGYYGWHKKTWANEYMIQLGLSRKKGKRFEETKNQKPKQAILMKIQSGTPYPSKLISIPKLTKKAQDVFNKWIRTRDQNKGCISCGKDVTEAGHYLSAGHYSALRFNEVNVNGQCTRCNCFLSGNLIKYRQGLVKRYGEINVLRLENSVAIRSVKKWSRFELEAIIKSYRC